MGLALTARAKLNLFLAVRAARPDGYHEIETVFHSIELADPVQIDAHRGLAVDCDPPVAVESTDNLAARAAAELADDAGIAPDAAIAITKLIPEAAGLGGGSADAAAALVGTNRLWGLDWPDDRLRTVGSAIGADVAFLIGGGAAIGRGRGDELEPVAPWPGLRAAIALPAAKLSTSQVYSGCRPDKGGVPVEGAAAALLARSLDALRDLMRNDLTDAAVERAPAVGAALSLASDSGLPALMSGSGPSVFALSDDPERLGALSAAWRSAGFTVIETALACLGVTLK